MSKVTKQNHKPLEELEEEVGEVIFDRDEYDQKLATQDKRKNQIDLKDKTFGQLVTEIYVDHIERISQVHPEITIIIRTNREFSSSLLALSIAQAEEVFEAQNMKVDQNSILKAIKSHNDSNSEIKIKDGADNFNRVPKILTVRDAVKKIVVELPNQANPKLFQYFGIENGAYKNLFAKLKEITIAEKEQMEKQINTLIEEAENIRAESNMHQGKVAEDAEKEAKQKEQKASELQEKLKESKVITGSYIHNLELNGNEIIVHTSLKEEGKTSKLPLLKKYQLNEENNAIKLKDDDVTTTIFMDKDGKLKMHVSDKNSPDHITKATEVKPETLAQMRFSREDGSEYDIVHTKFEGRDASLLYQYNITATPKTDGKAVIKITAIPNIEGQKIEITHYDIDKHGNNALLLKDTKYQAHIYIGDDNKVYFESNNSVKEFREEMLLKDSAQVHLSIDKVKVDTAKSQKKFEEETKKKAEEEAKKKAEEETKKKAEEEAKKKAEEEAKKKAEEETKKKAEEEARKKAEEETKKKAEEETRKKAEEEAKKKAEEEAKKKAEEETRKKAEEEAEEKVEEETRKKAEEEAEEKVEGEDRTEKEENSDKGKTELKENSDKEELIKKFVKGMIDPEEPNHKIGRVSSSQNPFTKKVQNENNPLKESKQALSAFLEERLMDAIDETKNPEVAGKMRELISNSKYVDTARSITLQAFSHIKLDGKQKIQGASFRYRGEKDIAGRLESAAEFIVAVLKFACNGFKGDYIEKWQENKTELVIKDPLEFNEFLVKVQNEQKVPTDDKNKNARALFDSKLSELIDKNKIVQI